MWVDVEDGHITIDPGVTTLKNDQKLQLGFWNFKKRQNSFVSDNLKQLDKVIDYLKKEQVDFNLTNSAQNYINLTSEFIKQLADRTESALRFKEGKFNKPDFDSFNDSIGKIIKRKLKDHQVKATYHLSLIENGANFSVPGSGKTSVVLAYFQKLRQEKKVNTLFVVGPPACFFPWKDEYKEVIGDTPRTKIISGLQKDNRIFKYT
jgi:hypothetical protein